MNDSVRLRLLVVGLAAVGLAVGTGLGALAGSALSPDEEVAGPSTTSTTTTTVPSQVPEIEPGVPLPIEGPLVTAVGIGPGALLSIQTDMETGGTGLFRLGVGGVADRIDLGFGGPVLGFGRSAAVVDATTGALVVPLDGSPPTLLETADAANVIDGTLAWLEQDPDGSWTAWTVDLDEPGAGPVAHSRISLPSPAGPITPWALHLDDDGAVVVSDRIWVAPAEGVPWSLDGPWPQAVLPDVLVVTTPPETGDGAWTYATYDRRSGAVRGPLPSPVDGITCWPIDAGGDAIAWECEDGRAAVSSPNGTQRLASTWATLVDGGRTAIWYSGDEGETPFAVRVTDVATGETGSVRSDHPILEVRP